TAVAGSNPATPTSYTLEGPQIWSRIATHQQEFAEALSRSARGSCRSGAQTGPSYTAVLTVGWALTCCRIHEQSKYLFVHRRLLEPARPRETLYKLGPRGQEIAERSTQDPRPHGVSR